jgi:hypothetical protein
MKAKSKRLGFHINFQDSGPMDYDPAIGRVRLCLSPGSEVVPCTFSSCSPCSSAQTLIVPTFAGEYSTKPAKPLRGATAFIHTAAARVGINPYCPSCYADCAKSANTEDVGAFVIRSPDPNLIFRVLVVREGYKPAFVEKVDPFKGPIRAELMPIDKDRLKDRHFVRGRVVDGEGKPVVWAEISAYTFKTESYWGFSQGIFDPVAVSNQEGAFLLTSNSPIEYVDVQIKTRGFAGKIAADLAPGKPEATITLNRGAFLAGRLRASASASSR